MSEFARSLDCPMRNAGFLLFVFLTASACSIKHLPRPLRLTVPAVVYLTFDADMTANMRGRLAGGRVKMWYDPALIDYLSQAKIPATVFVTGLFAEVYPDLVRRLSRIPNFAIGNHTYDHAAFTRKCFGLTSVSAERDKIFEIQETQRILAKLTGRRPRVFRFPGLCRGDGDDQLVAHLGLKIVDADVVSGDAFEQSSQNIVDNVLSGARNQAVILMHLGGPNAPASTAALKVIIDGLRERGFRFKSL